MDAVEPNVFALLLFALLAGVASLVFYVLSGVFPLETRPDLRSPLALTLTAGNIALLLLLLTGGLAYGMANLRWTSLVIVVGCAILFAPALFNVWPSRWRDGQTGLAIVFAGLSAALLLLRTVGSDV